MHSGQYPIKPVSLPNRGTRILPYNTYHQMGMGVGFVRFKCLKCTMMSSSERGICQIRSSAMKPMIKTVMVSIHWNTVKVMYL